MSVHYYIAASLPMLGAPDQEPPIAEEDMLDVCNRFMKEEDYDDLVASGVDPSGDDAGGICGKYRLWEKSLRNDLARLRSEALGMDPDAYVHEADVVFGTEAVAVEAMGKQTPLEAELYLDSQRWALIDQLTTGHYFDLEFLRGYRMKLQILERRAMFDEEKGFAAYRDLYGRVLAASGAEVPVGG